MACTATASRSVKGEVADSVEISDYEDVENVTVCHDYQLYKMSMHDYWHSLSSPHHNLKGKGCWHSQTAGVLSVTSHVCRSMCSVSLWGEKGFLLPSRLFPSNWLWTAWDDPCLNTSVQQRMSASRFIPFLMELCVLFLPTLDVNTVIQARKIIFRRGIKEGRNGGNPVYTAHWKLVDCPVRRQPTTLRNHEPITVEISEKHHSIPDKMAPDYIYIHHNTKARDCCNNYSNKPWQVLAQLQSFQELRLRISVKSGLSVWFHSISYSDCLLQKPPLYLKCSLILAMIQGVILLTSNLCRGLSFMALTHANIHPFQLIACSPWDCLPPFSHHQGSIRKIWLGR